MAPDRPRHPRPDKGTINKEKLVQALGRRGGPDGDLAAAVPRRVHFR